MSEWMNFVKPELLALIPALWCLGMIVKRSEIADRHIPKILGVSGVVLAAMYVVATMDGYTVQTVAMGMFTACVQGGLCAGMAVFGDQIVKQEHKKGEDNYGKTV